MPLLHILESIFFMFLMIAWVWAVISVISDVILSNDLSGLAKGLWVLFIIGIPWLGVLCYLLVRGSGMGDRITFSKAKSEHARQAFIKESAGISNADELSKLAALRDKGILTEAEFEAQKSKLLG